MSTRGLIAIMDGNGTCRSIYCHCDMYPDGAGVKLQKHYATKEDIEALLALGDLCCLGDTPAECDAFCRDGGEELHPPVKWDDKTKMRLEAYDKCLAEYVYLFMDGKWHVSEYSGDYRPVDDVLKEAEENQ